jgi:hypothetical protein
MNGSAFKRTVSSNKIGPEVVWLIRSSWENEMLDFNAKKYPLTFYGL